MCCVSWNESLATLTGLCVRDEVEVYKYFLLLHSTAAVLDQVSTALTTFDITTYMFLPSTPDIRSEAIET